jgi:hypothetical protein
MPFVDHIEQLGWEVTWALFFFLPFFLFADYYPLDRVCIPDSQKSWIGKSMMIKDKIGISYYHRGSKEVSHHRRHASDFVLVSPIFLFIFTQSFFFI